MVKTPQAGALRDRITFQVESNAPDGGGGNTTTWVDVNTVWGEFMPERGRERMHAGRLEASLAGTLTIRSSTDTRTLTAAHRAVIKGVPYQIRSVSNPDRKDRFIEMTVERGVAT